MTMLVARRRDTGEEVDVLDVAGTLAFVAPKGSGGIGAKFVPADLLDPDPGFLAAVGEFRSWTDESRALA